MNIKIIKAFVMMAIALGAHPSFSEDAEKEDSAVSVVDPVTTCKIEQFSPGLKKAPTAAFKACASLKDQKEEPSKSASECKEKALERGKACLEKIPSLKQLAVKGKFTETFEIRSQSTSFVCELDNTGGSRCP